MGSHKVAVSAVIPVYNERENVAGLHKELISSLSSTNEAFEIIYVDDGSTDGSNKELATLKPATVITLRRNFGQTAALDAGIKHAQGKYIVTLDADGQNDPADIPMLVKTLEENGLDVVSGWRRLRADPLGKRLSSRMAALARRFIINDGIHDSGCTLKVYRRECFDNVNLSGEMHRFIPGQLAMKGFRIGEREVNHRPRRFGKTKYGLSRGLKGILDMFSVWFWRRYAKRPLHLFGSAGALLIFLSVVAMGVAVYLRVVYGHDLSDTALTTLSFFMFLIGVQFVLFGLIADMLSKTYYEASGESTYEIRDVRTQ